jgi:hypothetical protein
LEKSIRSQRWHLAIFCLGSSFFHAPFKNWQHDNISNEKIPNEKSPNEKTPKIEIPNKKTPNVLKNAERPEKRQTVGDERTELLPLVRVRLGKIALFGIST